jgi:hypothetical protein
MNKSALSWCRPMVWMPLLLFVLTALRLVFMQPLEHAVALTAMDDGLYYPRLAEQIIQTGRCTYDGVTATNGFHPLWLILQVPVFFLIRNPWMALWCVYGLIFIVQLISLRLFFSLARELNMTASGWSVALFFLVINLRSFTIFFSFLESPLVLLLLSAYLVFSVKTGRDRFSSFRKSFFAGLLIGACFLSRIDTFLLVPAYAALWFSQLLRSPRRWRMYCGAAFSAAVGCLLFVGPYLLINRWIFGYWQTVSAWQKTAQVSPASSWKIISGWTVHQFIPRLQMILGLEKIPGFLLLTLLLVGGIAVAVCIFTGTRRKRTVRGLMLCPEFTIFVFFHAAFIVLVAPLEAAASAWYWVPEILLLAMIAGVAVPHWRCGRIPVATAAVILLTGFQLAACTALTQRKTMSFAKLEVACYLRKNTAQDFRGAMFDSGIISYFSRRDMVGINGLIGDFVHAEQMRNRDYAGAFRRCGVDFLILDTPLRMIPKMPATVLYQSEIQTKFENFSEPPKPFVVYSGTPADLGAVWNLRYSGRR